MTEIVCFDRYELQIDVTRCLVVPPNPYTWDSDPDYIDPPTDEELAESEDTAIFYSEDNQNDD